MKVLAIALIALLGVSIVYAADAKKEEPAAEAAPTKTEGEVKEIPPPEKKEDNAKLDNRPRGRCEICIYVLVRKIRDEPELCTEPELTRDPIYHAACKEVLEAMVRWDQNVVHWLYNHGCRRYSNDGAVVNVVRPCPPHAVCSWLTFKGAAFCEQDRFYKQ